MSMPYQKAILGRPLTPSEQLENVRWFMTHCDKCDAEVGWAALVCECCGCELVEYGKN